MRLVHSLPLSAVLPRPLRLAPLLLRKHKHKPQARRHRRLLWRARRRQRCTANCRSCQMRATEGTQRVQGRAGRDEREGLGRRAER
jgi:hypothetical protein